MLCVYECVCESCCCALLPAALLLGQELLASWVTFWMARAETAGMRMSSSQPMATSRAGTCAQQASTERTETANSAA